MRYRLQRHDGTDCSATMVPITVLRMVPIQRYRHCYQRITGTYETVLVIPAWEGRYHLFFDLFHQYLKTCSSPGSMVMAFIPFRVGMFSTPFPPSDLIRISFLSI